MKFRTEYEMRPSERLLDPAEPVVLIGSCFTDSIGKRMVSCRWPAFPNPCGTLFNPASIANIIRLALADEQSVRSAVDASLAERDGLSMSWLVDSGSTKHSQIDTISSLYERINSLRSNLASAATLIVTFGTAWIYELREQPGYVVSNCHKFPAGNFVRRRLSVDDIVSEWKSLLDYLKERFPRLRVIFTVSPVRHLKDGFEGNSRSKAILQLSCEEICEKCESAEYFPSFEIMNDDLRDYRFYDRDMVHPSEMAVDYIWEKFQERFLSAESRAILREGEKITRRLNHRPIIK